MPEQILQNEAPHPRARIECGENEQGLEHDRKVIPQRQRGVARQHA